MKDEFDLGEIRGLSDEEASRRLAEEGYNQIPGASRRGLLRIGFEVVREPMFLLLVAAGTVYLVLGDRQQAVLLLTFIAVIIGITIYQERRTSRAIEALRDLSSPRASVIRSGDQKRIPGRDVVRGDVVLLEEGDRVPADGVLDMCVNLSIDESLITGESVPVRKLPCDEPPRAAPGGEDLPFVWSGTLVVSGRGVARVTATGQATEMGRIGKALESIEPEPTPLQAETRRVVKVIASLGGMLCVMVAVIYGLTRRAPGGGYDWLTGILVGLTLAMAMLPEEFPVVLTIFLTMGAWRISRKEVLTRRVPAVETLGSATVLCVDKTGTLTHNRISVSRLASGEMSYDLGDHKRQPLPEELHELVEYSILASQKDPFDPIERAIKRLGERKLFDTEHLHDDWSLKREYPLSGDLLALSNVWKSPGGDEFLIAAKGAPEAVVDLCHLPAERRGKIMERVAEMADDGLRVIGVARSLFRDRALPVDQHEFVFEFLGLVGLADPVRANVPASVAECRDAGIRVVMITGDYPGTATNVARQIGLSADGGIMTGQELDELSDSELRARINDVDVFARVVPEQKLRIVDALKASGEVVAMTGDGVNDAPALKSANIGIAMGGRGTDVARESAALVLVNDDFSSIVEAVRLGRRIFDNLKKAMSYIVAIHIPIAGMSLIPVLFKLPLVLLPVQIAFLELVIDPACSIVFEGEREEKDVMERPPRDLSEPLFSRRTVVLSLLQGLFVLAMTLLIFRTSMWRGLPTDQIRALTFTTLVVANLALILTNRSWTRTIRMTMAEPNVALWIVIGGALALLGLVLYLPPLQRLFHLGGLGALDLALAFGAGGLSIAWFEGLKYMSAARGGASRPGNRT